ncbi:MAG: GatB/YqeY domain-containing protein [Myxococcota bacterium]|nr:GatB/YqeY domain-containing protein [Myxococcota bacterium]
MNLGERLEADMKAAMRERDKVRLETIRGVRGAVRNREIEAGGSLDDDGIVRVLRSLVKQRVDAIEQFRAGGREDLAEKESREREILEAYLPAAPDAGDVERVVREVIAEVGAESPRDMGRVMKPALERLGGGADGKQVSETVRRLLSPGEAG